jgi:hypothetical protein
LPTNFTTSTCARARDQGKTRFAKGRRLASFSVGFDSVFDAPYMRAREGAVGFGCFAGPGRGSRIGSDNGYYRKQFSQSVVQGRVDPTLRNSRSFPPRGGSAQQVIVIRSCAGAKNTMRGSGDPPRGISGLGRGRHEDSALSDEKSQHAEASR